MKVANRVGLGYGVLLLFIAALLAVQTFGFRRLSAIIGINSGDNLRLALVAVDLVRDGDAIEEHARLYFAAGDKGVKEEMKESQQRFEDALREIRDFKGSEREQAEVDRLDRFWREYREGPAKAEPQIGAKSGTAGLPDDLAESLSRLRIQSLTVYQVLLEDMRRQAADSRKSSERVELMAWWVGCTTLLFGALLAYLVIRSLSGPLRNLSEGTRALAEGKSYYRLDTSRSDELSQIARDFNTIVEKVRVRAGTTDQDSKKIEL